MSALDNLKIGILFGILTASQSAEAKPAQNHSTIGAPMMHSTTDYATQGAIVGGVALLAAAVAGLVGVAVQGRRQNRP